MGGKYEEIRGRKKERDTYRKIQGNAERSAMIDTTRCMGDLGRSGRHTGRSEGNTGSSEIGDAGRIIREMERRFQEEI
jgi:hypothetical protein